MEGFSHLYDFRFNNRMFGMLWNAHIKTHTKPLVDKRECVMGFHTGTTTTFGFFRANDILYWTKA